MPEREQSLEQQPEKKYVLPDENIIECDENSPLLKQLPKSLRELPWPMEIQGAGVTIKEKKEFKIWYPKGDVFLSMAVIIHELGHLRQTELNPDLDVEKDFKSDSDFYEVNIIREKDANIRGWERVNNFCPEIVKELEDKFQESKSGGRLSRYKDFVELYNFFCELTLFINNFYKEFEGQKGGEMRKKIKKKHPKIKEKELKQRITQEARESLAEAIKDSEEIYDFFRNTDNFRAGEKLNSNFARNFIKQTAEKIADEKY